MTLFLRFVRCAALSIGFFCGVSSTRAQDFNAPPPAELVPTTEAEHLADHLLVVYNDNDPDSRVLAHYYATRRNIPPVRVFPIECSNNEEITRADYEKTIRQPILFYLLQNRWLVRRSVNTRIGTRYLQLLVATRNDIWAIVLIRGVPLKIAPDPSDDDAMDDVAWLKASGAPVDNGVAGLFRTNAAAVDSELALLPIFGLPRGGFVPNIFFDPRGTGLHRVGSAQARNMILVSRLDGPTPAQVRRMIDDSIYAEQNRLAGLAVIDTQGITDKNNGLYAGDLWLRNSRTMLLRDGWTVKFDDKPDVLPASDPCNQVALYMGWYTDTARGPWVTSPNRFVPGAIAYHLHSFNASTVRSENANWVGPLIAHGADATMGTVYEPLLSWTPHEDIFTARLLAGNYFAEAAYASIEGLSWMVTVVGDPLYRPFRVPLDSAVAAAQTPHTEHDDWLLLQQVRRELAFGQIQPKTDALQESLDVAGAGPVAEEYLGDLLQVIRDPQPGFSVDQAYRKAGAAYTLPIDRIRVGLKLAQYYMDHGQGGRVLAQLDMLRQLYPLDASRFGVDIPLVPSSSNHEALVVAKGNDAAKVPAPVVESPSPEATPSTPAVATPAPVAAPTSPPKPLLPPVPQPAPVEQ